MASVAIAETRVFAIDLEGPLHPARGQHRERLVLNPREARSDPRRSIARGLAVDLGEQRPAPADLLGGQTDGQRQVVDPKATLAGVLLDVPRIKLGPENAGVLAAKAVAVVQVGRQMDAAGNAILARANEVEPRRKARPVGPRGHVRRSRRQDVDAGQHHVRRVLVTGQAVRHRSDHRQLVGPGRQTRQMLAVARLRAPWWRST